MTAELRPVERDRPVPQAPRRQPPAPQVVAVQAVRERPAAASPRRRPQATVAQESLQPWWFAVPAVLLACLRWAVMPIHVAVRAAEAAVAIAILAILGTVGAWWLGHVSDQQVVAALKPVGERILAMVQSVAGM